MQLTRKELIQNSKFDSVVRYIGMSYFSKRVNLKPIDPDKLKIERSIWLRAMISKSS